MCCHLLLGCNEFNDIERQFAHIFRCMCILTLVPQTSCKVSVVSFALTYCVHLFVPIAALVHLESSLNTMGYWVRFFT